MFAFSTVSGLLEGRLPGFRTESSSCNEFPSQQEQVVGGEQRDEPGSVFVETVIAGIHMAERALDRPEGVLDLCPELP